MKAKAAEAAGKGAGRFWRRPLDRDEVVLPRGEITVIETRCKGCAFCVEFCPTGALAISRRFNPKGYHPPDVAAPDSCVACRLCEALCPEFAIFVRESARPGARRATSEAAT